VCVCVCVMCVCVDDELGIPKPFAVTVDCFSLPRDETLGL